MSARHRRAKARLRTFEQHVERLDGLLDAIDLISAEAECQGDMRLHLLSYRGLVKVRRDVCESGERSARLALEALYRREVDPLHGGEP